MPRTMRHAFGRAASYGALPATRRWYCPLATLLARSQCQGKVPACKPTAEVQDNHFVRCARPIRVTSSCRRTGETASPPTCVTPTHASVAAQAGDTVAGEAGSPVFCRASQHLVVAPAHATRKFGKGLFQVYGPGSIGMYAAIPGFGVGTFSIARTLRLVLRSNGLDAVTPGEEQPTCVLPLCPGGFRPPRQATAPR